MRLFNFLKRAEGSAAVEFAFVGPILFALMLAIIQGGLMVWTQLGLQHAVESAARCVAINTSTCSSASATQNYAATQAYGLKMPASVFSSSAGSCGNLVTASYTFYFFTKEFSAASVPLAAQACFPS